MVGRTVTRLRILFVLLVAAAVGSWFVVRMRRHAPIPVSGPVAFRHFIVDLPKGSTLRFLQGIDTVVGELKLGGVERTLNFDIGYLAGNYALNQGSNGSFRWQRHEKNDGMPMDYALQRRNLNEKDVFVVSFSSLGPANFWAHVENDREIESILKVMRTVRAKSLPQKQAPN